MKRFGLLFFFILLIPLLAGAAEWEGTGTVSSSGLLPDEGYYVATNAFPRNTVVDITNLESRKTVRVIVASGLDSPGMLAMVSRDAANAIGLSSTAIGRIRLSVPNSLGVAFGTPEDRVSRSGDPDFDPRAAASRYSSPEEEPAWIYPEEINTRETENNAPVIENNVPIMESPLTNPVVSAFDDSIFTEVSPESAWSYPLEIDETLDTSSIAAEEDLSEDPILLIEEDPALAVTPEGDEIPAVAILPEIDTTPAAAVIPEPDTTPDISMAAVGPAFAEDDDIPETIEPPVLVDADGPSVAVIPAQIPPASSSEAIKREEIYEAPDSSITVVEPGVTEADFPEVSNPPLLIGDEPSVAVIAAQTPPASSDEAAEKEETYETPDSSISVVEPVVGEEEVPESDHPPMIAVTDDPAVTEILADVPPSLAISETEPDSPAADNAEYPEMETELALVPTGSRPPESGAFDLPKESEISALPETSSVTHDSNVSQSHTFSVPVISSLDQNAYYVQLGAFSEANSVEQVILDIGSSFPLKVLQPSRSGSDTLYRILLGPVNIGEGSALLQRFKTRGYRNAFLLPNRGY